MRHTINLLQQIIKISKKLAGWDTPEQRFHQYKEDHPKTQKQPNDPIFVGKTTGKKDVPAANHKMYASPEALRTHTADWNEKDHGDAADIHNQKRKAVGGEHKAFGAWAERQYKDGQQSRNRHTDGTDPAYPGQVNEHLKDLHGKMKAHSNAVDMHKGLSARPDVAKHLRELGVG